VTARTAVPPPASHAPGDPGDHADRDPALGHRPRREEGLGIGRRPRLDHPGRDGPRPGPPLQEEGGPGRDHLGDERDLGTAGDEAGLDAQEPVRALGAGARLGVRVAAQGRDGVPAPRERARERGLDRPGEGRHLGVDDEEERAPPVGRRPRARGEVLGDGEDRGGRLGRGARREEEGGDEREAHVHLPLPRSGPSQKRPARGPGTRPAA
jgi:hypothetical protein